MEQNRRQTGPQRIIFHGIFEVVDGNFIGKIDKWYYEGIIFAIIHLHQALVERAEPQNRAHIIDIVDVCGQALLLDTAKYQQFNYDVDNMKIELTETVEPCSMNVESVTKELTIENAKLIHILLGIRWLLVGLVHAQMKALGGTYNGILTGIYEELKNKKKVLYYEEDVQ